MSFLQTFGAQLLTRKIFLAAWCSSLLLFMADPISIEVMRLFRMDEPSAEGRLRRSQGGPRRDHHPSGLTAALSVKLDGRHRVEVDAGPRLRLRKPP